MTLSRINFMNTKNRLRLTVLIFIIFAANLVLAQDVYPNYASSNTNNLSDFDYFLDRGEFYKRNGDYEKSLHFFDKALNYSLKNKASQMTRTLYEEIALIYEIQKNNKLALKYLLDKYDFELKNKNFTKPEVFLKIAKYYFEENNDSNSEIFLEKAKESAQLVGSKKVIEESQIIQKALDDRKNQMLINKNQQIQLALANKEKERLASENLRQKLEVDKQKEQAMLLKLEAQNAKIQLDKSEIEKKQLASEKKNLDLVVESQKQKLAIEKERKEKAFQQNLNYAFVIGLIIAIAFVVFILRSLKIQKRQKNLIEIERQKSEQLLMNILPAEVAIELKEKGITEVRYFMKASVLFADVKGFSALAGKVTPQELIQELDFTFGAFDDISEKFNLERIKTIGDCYMCAGGVPHKNETNPIDITLAAIGFQDWMNREREKRNGNFWQVRLGIHTGELVAGVIGKTKFAYDIWGNTVNLASRLETGGDVGKVNISETTYQEIKDFFDCTPRGKIEAKNIGLVETYFVEQIKTEYSVNGEGKEPNEKFWKLLNKRNSS